MTRRPHDDDRCVAKPPAQALRQDDEASKTVIGLMPAGIKVKRSQDGKRDVVELDEGKKDAFVQCGGSDIPAFNITLLREVLSCLWIGDKDDNATTRVIQTAHAALRAFKPANEIEGMIAAQAVALHFGAMECLRRTMIPEQPYDVAARLRKDAANMMRAMTEMLDALDRKRGKAPQIVRVERVVVHEGGQAIVGNVAPGGRGDGSKREGEAHAQNLRG